MADFEDMMKTSCRMLTHADSDVEKMAALLYATPCIQSDQNDAKSLTQLFQSIGSPFLLKMLSGHLDVSLDVDAVDVYRPTALNIIVCFCVVPEIAKNKNVLKMIPQVFELLRRTEEPAEILESAMQYFKCIIQHDEGRRALSSYKAIKDFAWIYSKFKSDHALDFIDILLRNDHVEKDNSCLNFLMTSLAEEFSKNQTSKKFTLCHHLFHIISLHKHADRASIANQKWPKLILKGLKDILSSRIDNQQRVPALKLASVMVDSYGMEWAVSESQLPSTATPEQRKFQLLLVHLSSIECRMQMEDQPISSILKNAELIIACFAIMEKAVQDLLVEHMEMREKDQIVQAYCDAAVAVLSSIAAISGFPETVTQHKIFVYAMMEFLLSGFAYDVLTCDAEVYKYMSFIMKVAENSYLEYKKWYCENASDSKDNAPIDLFEFLVPAFQHFATTVDGQKVIIDQMDVILAHVDFSWSIVEPAARESATGMSGSQMSHCTRSSYSLLVKITEMLTDVILVQPEAIQQVPQFSTLLEKISTMLPILENSSVFHSLLSTASILGLVLIKHKADTFQEEDDRVVSVLNGSVQFLKTYKPKILNTEAAAFQVGDNTQFWVNIREMCLLGEHLLSHLVQAMPWIEPHIKSLSPTILDDIKKQAAEESSVLDT